jgi:hypothetical protein
VIDQKSVSQNSAAHVTYGVVSEKAGVRATSIAWGIVGHRSPRDRAEFEIDSRARLILKEQILTWEPPKVDIYRDDLAPCERRSHKRWKERCRLSSRSCTETNQFSSGVELLLTYAAAGVELLLISSPSAVEYFERGRCRGEPMLT